MSRIVKCMSALVLLVGIGGCGSSEKPAEPTTQTEAQKKEMNQGMEQMTKFHNQSQQQGQAQPAGDAK